MDKQGGRSATRLRVRKGAEQRLRLQYAVSRLLAAAHTLHEAAEPLLETIGTDLGWDVGFLWVRQARKNELECAQAWYTAGPDAPKFAEASCGTRFPKGIGLPGQVWQQRQPVWITDVSADTSLPRQAEALSAKLRTAVGFPILDRGSVVGVIEFFSKARREADQGVTDLLESVGNQIAQFIERSRGEEALRQSESRKAAILEAALDCIITIDAKSRIIEFNPAAERTFGYTREQVLGASMPELIIPEPLREAHYAGMAHYLATGEARILARRIGVTARRADGSTIPVELAITRLATEDPPVFTAYLRDLSERTESQRALKRSEGRYRALFENVLEGVYQSDAEGNLLAANPALVRMLGFETADELRIPGTVQALYVDAADRARRLEELERAGELRNAEIRLRRRDGSEIVVLENTRIVRDEAGKSLLYEGTLIDITERKAAEEELRRAKEAAEAANRTKSEFLANMSHELRTPLNAIIGYSEMLQEEAEDRNVAELIPDLRKIQTAGQHLLSLINDVLDLTKVEAGRMQLYIERFDVSSLVREVAETVKPLIESGGNTLDLAVQPDAGAMYADTTKLRQTLMNLLSNAGKFTSHGKVSLSARRETLEGRDWMVFSVADTGIGISPAKIETIFDAFSQGDASTSKIYGGTGLGLAITRHFCRLMGGDVAVESEVGKGSTFTVRLPARVVISGPDVEVPSVRHGGGAKPVLVVDDDPAMRELICRWLEQNGTSTVEAANGREALRIAREIHPAAITLDIIMPEMDGWATLTALKADPDLRDIPVVVTTVSDDRALGYALGAAHYITKPIDRERLSGILGRYRCLRPPCPVLVVEDDIASRELLRGLLERDGWLAVTAEDGAVAIERLKEHRFQLILLDLMMPRMDGFAFTRVLREHPEWRTIPVIVVTAMDMTEEDRKRLNGSIQGVIAKAGLNREELLREIRSVLSNSACPAAVRESE